jgi:CRISPR-associated protein Csx17
VTRLRLAGCRTRPLGSYLKALGVLRLVGAQVDPSARGAWHGDVFHLFSQLGEDDLVDFFMSTYAPTPIVSPWNGGSGFGPKDQQAGIAAIEASDDPRFVVYRAAIAAGRRLVADPGWAEGGADTKRRQLLRCRAELPDLAVDWLDASVVLAGDRAVFPPLFGTGGNDGRLDFSNNFMQRLAEMLLLPRRRGAPDPVAWLRGALYGDDTGPLLDASVGQYDPSAGESGATAASGRETRLANPWDFVLLIEGGLAFASGAARRLGTESDIRAAMPFCVDGSPVGSPTTAEGEQSRGELWAPVWRRPTTAGEITRLIGEGRVHWAGRRVANGVDFAKAVATLGVDRGIDRFVRHGFAQRYGLTFLAVPLDEVVVGDRPDVRVLDSVDRWVRSLRRDLPAAAAAARRRVEATEYRAVSGGRGPVAADLQDVLVAVAELEVAVARSSKRDEFAPRPVQGLVAADWLPKLDDGTAELRLAVAIASARDRFNEGTLDLHSRRASSLAVLLRPVQLDDSGRRLVWSPGAPRVPGLGRQQVDSVLAAALVRRSLDVLARSLEDEAAVAGPRMAFDTGFTVPVSDVVALLGGQVDVGRLDRLVRGLLLLDWRRPSGSDGLVRPEHLRRTWRASPALAALAPFFQALPVRTAGGEGMPAVVVLRPGAGWPALLAADRPDDVLKDAVHRLRVAGLRPGPAVVRRRPVETGPRLAVAALCRVTPSDAAGLLLATCPAELLPYPRSSTEPTAIEEATA